MDTPFDEAEYEEHDFEGVAIPEGRVADVDFIDCRFKGCDLSAAELLRCRFVRCSFESSNLSSVKLVDTRIAEARFVNTKVIGIDWTQVSPLSRLELVFVDCDLSWSSFLELDLRRFSLTRCRAVEADFSGAKLAKAVFADTELSGARFSHTDLSSADLTSAKNYTIDPTINRLTKARFSIPEALSLLGAFDIVIE